MATELERQITRLYEHDCSEMPEKDLKVKDVYEDYPAEEFAVQLLCEASISIFKDIQKSNQRMCAEIDSCLNYCRNYKS